MKNEVIKQTALSLAQTTGLMVRIFQNGKLTFLAPEKSFQPDSLCLYQTEVLAMPMAAVYVTPLYQFYGCLKVSSIVTLVFGPTQLRNEDTKMLKELMIDLDIDVNQQNEYQQLLQCAPAITLQRFCALTAFISGLIHRKVCKIEDVQIHQSTQMHELSLVETPTDNFDSENTGNDLSYHLEKLISLYVESGQPHKIQQLFSSMPKARAGKMAADQLRQMKDVNICSAAVFSRAAIAGGLTSQAAFRLSDLYIQQIEMIQDTAVLEKINEKMIVDFAKQVSRQQLNQTNSALAADCVAYISQHVFEKIKVEDLAAVCGYSRSYLSTQFKKETGFSLQHYILQEKVVEAKRLLKFTAKPLCDIAAALAFSSQSHFQSVFKSYTGLTPANYRQQNRL